MKIVLALCPCWSVNAPSLTLASLAAFLRQAGYSVIVKDLNHALYTRVSEQDRQYWAVTFERHWQNEAAFRALPFLSPDTSESWAQEILNENPDMVCFSLFTTTTRATLSLAEALKKKRPGLPIIIGGPDAYRTCATAPLVKANQFDYMALGEGELSLLRLAQDLERDGNGEAVPGILAKRGNGELICGGEIVHIKDLDQLPFPDYDDYVANGVAGHTLLPISWARGCVARCAFCFEVAFWRNKYRQKSVDYLVREIQSYIDRYNIRNFHFNDSLVNGNIPKLEELCDRLVEEKLNIRWKALARVHEGMTTRFIEKMAAAGCTNLMYGIESGSQKVLDLMNKRVNASLAEETIRATYDGGIRPGVSLLVGFPGEEESDFLETVDFVRRNGKYLSFVNIAGLGIMPFTPIDRKKKDLDIDFVSGGVWTTADRSNSIEERARRIRILAEVAAEHVDQTYAFVNQ
jgi:anaerobic magnesium-protoporphyrin IX monomethyl ester cyclase